MGFFDFIKKVADVLEDDFYTHPGLTKNKPSCDNLRKKVEDLEKWIQNNTYLKDERRNPLIRYTNSTPSKRIIPKSKLAEFNNLNESLKSTILSTKVEIECIVSKSSCIPRASRSAHMEYVYIQDRLRTEYNGIVRRLEFILKDLYTES